MLSGFREQKDQEGSAFNGTGITLQGIKGTKIATKKTARATTIEVVTLFLRSMKRVGFHPLKRFAFASAPLYK